MSVNYNLKNTRAFIIFDTIDLRGLVSSYLMCGIKEEDGGPTVHHWCHVKSGESCLSDIIQISSTQPKYGMWHCQLTALWQNQGRFHSKIYTLVILHNLFSLKI